MNLHLRSWVLLVAAVVVLTIVDIEWPWFPAIGVGSSVGLLIGRNESP